MKKRIVSGLLSLGLLIGSAVPSVAATSRHRYRHTQHRQNLRHKRHVDTARRVGIGAGGGAAIGALAGGGKGAAIGGLAGAGAGALYDGHKKSKGQ